MNPSPALLFYRVMPKDSRQQIVDTVLSRKDQASPAARSALDRAVKKHIRIDGFRNVNKAPRKHLQPALVELSVTLLPVADTLLTVWVEVNGALRDSVKELTQGHSIDVNVQPLARKPAHSVASEPESSADVDADNDVLESDFYIGFSAWIQELLEANGAHANLDVNEVALMALVLFGTQARSENAVVADAQIQSSDDGTGAVVAEPDSDNEPSGKADDGGASVTHSIDNSSRWDRWLAELQLLAPDSSEWDGVDQFADDLLALAKEKRQLLNTRRVVQDSILRLRYAANEQLEFFGFADIESWDAANCPLDSAQDVASQIETLIDQLQAYEQMSHVVTESLEERRRVRNQQSDLEASIVSQYNYLKLRLIPPQVVADSDFVDTQGSISLEEPAEELVSIQNSPVDDPRPQLENHLSEAAVATEVQTVSEQDHSVQTPPIVEDDSPGDSESPEESANVKDSLDEVIAQAIPASVGEMTETVKSVSDTADSAQHQLSDVQQIAAEEPRDVGSDSITSTVEDDISRDALLWTLIAEDDLPGAYWISRSISAQSETPPVPPELLTTIVGGRWLSEDTLDFTGDLLEISNQFLPDTRVLEYALLAMAAALRPSLLAPMVGLQNWLDIPAIYPALSRLGATVTEFARLNIALEPDDIKGATGAHSLEERLSRRVQDATRWLTDARELRPSFKRAADVWRTLVNPDGPLDTLLRPVRLDSRREVVKVKSAVEQWRSAQYAGKVIDEIDREITGQKKRPIEGGARQYLEHGIRDACDHAERWTRLVEQDLQVATKGKWRSDHVNALRSGIEEQMTDVVSELEELCDPSLPQPIQAAAQCLMRAVRQLNDTLGLDSVGSPETTESVSDEWYWRDASTLEDALNRRLFLLPELNLTDEGRSEASELSVIADAISQAHAVGRTLADVVAAWVDRQDYRFVESILEEMSDAGALRNMAIEQRAGSIRALRSAVGQVEQEIEQAVVDGILTEENRAAYQSALGEIVPESVMNFHSEFGRIEALTKTVVAEKQKRLGVLQDDWEELSQRLAVSHLPETVRDSIAGLVRVRFEHNDTRVVEEILAQLRQALDTGSDFSDQGLVAGRASATDLEDFVQVGPKLENWLDSQMRNGGLRAAAKEIGQGMTCGGIEFEHVPTARRDEAKRALDTWSGLKLSGAASDAAPAAVAELMRYIGFSLTLTSPVRVEDRGADWLHLQIEMSDSGLARPVPQFGSQTHGHYHIVCFWERPGTSTVAARLIERGLTQFNVIVIYLSRLTFRRRRDLIQTAREQSARMVVLDETLLVYLAKERDARLPVFLRCSMPYTTFSPYTPFQAGDLPPEMFFGREDMARRLMDPAGSCILYGGRQLGKSALLRHVQREFHNQEREHYAWVEDIKLIGDPLGTPQTSEIWNRIRDQFKEFGLISQRVVTTRPGEIIRYVREAMNNEPVRRVLILFDEADHFLNADARDNFVNVEEIRKLMSDTRRRLKVIFTGLHDVQRFQGIPNQPLAHFGTPLCVGPLEPQDAMALVREPIEALGFRFAEAATLLRTLSYTNYHPALIQFFCAKLLEQLHRSTSNASPPYSISQQHVAAVYRTSDVRRQIRDLLDLTLRLDKRYQAIAWLMIVNQLNMRDSFAHAYPAGKILKEVQDWWPQGFGSVGTDELRSLLDEMVGLGVLVRNMEGHYRLRSPNLVRLMGTEEDIANSLLKLSDESADVVFEADSHHTPLDGSAKRYSPLTFMQERNLNLSQSGVCLVFASDATGWRELPRAVENFARRDSRDSVDSSCAVLSVPSRVRDGESLHQWLSTTFDAATSCERTITYYRLTDESEDVISTLVQSGLDFCARQRKQNRWLRLIFLFGSRATSTWVSLPEETRGAMETRADTTTHVRLWDLSGIRQRLAQTEKDDKDDVCRTVLECTGGWPYLLDTLFERSANDKNPSTCALQMREELLDPTSRLRQDFYVALGLKPGSLHNRLLRSIKERQSTLDDLIAADTHNMPMGDSTFEHETALRYLERMACVTKYMDELSLAPFISEMIGDK